MEIKKKEPGRRADIRAERALGLFLDKYFYLPEKYSEFSKSERIYESDRQKKGTDLLLFWNGTEYKVDEKAQLRYINNPRPSFTLELESVNEEGKIVPGWFVSKSNETQMYIFLWIEYALETKRHRLVSEDFERVKAYMIMKDDLRQRILKELQIREIEELVEKGKQFREEISDAINKSKDIFNRDLKGGLEILISSYYDECPTNLKVPIRILDEVAIRRFIITKENVEQIQKGYA